MHINSSDKQINAEDSSLKKESCYVHVPLCLKDFFIFSIFSSLQNKCVVGKNCRKNVGGEVKPFED